MNTLKNYFSLVFLFLIVSIAVAEQKTNVLLVIADDMGVDAINGYGIGTDCPQTPHLDALRATGMTFTNVWSAPVCSATRASLITGKYGVHNEVNTLPGYLKPRHKTIFTEIAELDSSYATALVGKWHLAKANNLDHPLSHGVGHYMGVLGNGVDDYYRWLKVENGQQDTCYEYATRYFTDYAIDWIKQQDEKPWFMCLAHVAPHAPYHDVPEAMASSEVLPSKQNQYKRMIESLDYELGRMQDALSAEVWANTVVLFLGDNGTPGNVIQGFTKDQAKQTLYQGGIRVPFIMSGKGVTRQGEVEDALINVSDFYVTIAQLIDADAFPSDTAFDGYSFKSLLTADGQGRRTYNYMELGANISMPEDIYTVCDTRYKLLDLGSQGYEMYDIQNDGFEKQNLLNDSLAADVEEAKRRLLAQMDDVRGFSRTVSDGTGEQEIGTDGAYPIVHTGVSEFADASRLIATPDKSEDLYWQDAGRVINRPSYTDNGDGTVTDEVTGLMWQQDMGEKMTYDEAVLRLQNFTLAAYNDWRMPTIKELYSLIQFSGRVFGEQVQTYFIDTTYFDQPIGDLSSGEREIDAQTWSSTYYTSVTMQSDTTIFGVNFVDGRIKGYPKFKKRTGAANAMYFRFVRGNSDYGKNAFVDNLDGTVTDSATSLMWQQADDGVARDWVSSIAYCEALNLAAYDDWHLPTAKELQSIVDYSRSPDATQSAAIDPIFALSSIDDAEGNAGHFPYFWTTSPHKDGNQPYASAVYIAFGEAKGKMNNVLMDVHGAGAQRSDPKSGAAEDYPSYWGPQGDVRRVFNHCRCVRLLDDNAAAQTKLQDNPSSQVFPNPTTDELMVVFPNLSATLQVYNAQGSRVLSFSPHYSPIQVDMSAFEAGIYHFSLSFNDRNEVHRVMKK